MKNVDKKEKVEKKEKKVKVKKDRWFTFSGINKEIKRVRWPHWKSEGANNPGILQNTGEVIIFSAFFAVFFVLCDFVVTYLFKFVG